MDRLGLVDSSSIIKSKNIKFQQKRIKSICNIAWEKFDVDQFIENIKENFRILIYGCSKEGKGMLTAQILIKKILYNIDNKIPTILSATSDTVEANKLIVNICTFVLKKYPELEKSWNTENCLFQTSYHHDIVDFCEKLENCKYDPDVKKFQKIWLLDDMGTTLSKKTDLIKNFFDDLPNQGRHYNISYILCTQKFALPNNILNATEIFFFVGKIMPGDWDIFVKRIGKAWFDRKIRDEFHKHYNTLIGTSKSRNILVFQNFLVYLHKVSKEFSDLWDVLMNNTII